MLSLRHQTAGEHHIIHVVFPARYFPQERVEKPKTELTLNLIIQLFSSGEQKHAAK